MNTNKLISMLPDMGVFVLVVECGSFSAAATILNVTPSAVSRQISRLEAALEVRLLERTTRRQTPSDEGVEAYQKCRVLMDCAQEVGQLSSQSKTIQGDIRIAAPKAYSKHILQPLVHDFLASYPKVNIHFRVTDEFLNPQRDEIDLAIRLSDSLIDGLVSKPVHHIRSVLCASRQYADQRGLPQSPDQLVSHSCIALNNEASQRVWTFTNGNRKQTVKVTGRYSNNHSEMRLAAVEHGLGIGLFPDFVVQSALKQKRVVAVLPDWKINSTYQGDVHLQFSQNKFMPARLRAFIDFLTMKLKTEDAA